MPDVRQRLRTQGVIRKALQDIALWARSFPDDEQVEAACSYYARICDDLKAEIAGPARADRLDALQAQLEELRG